jgi:hypothetical protein
MKPLPRVPELLALAPRVIWFEEPEQALADPARFLAYVMTYGTAADIATVRQYVGMDGFTAALEAAPPGIIDARSWAYWNALAGRYPTPPMPQRSFPT